MIARAHHQRLIRLAVVAGLLLVFGIAEAVQAPLPQAPLPQAPVNRNRQIQGAQQVEAQAADNQDENTFTSSIKLPPDPRAKRKLDMAQQFIKSQDWTQAIKLLDSLLSAKEDTFLPGDGRARRQSVRAEANRLLGLLPKEGLQFYEQEYGVQARLLLNQGRLTGDPQIYADVALRYLHTEAGAEAAALLGAYHLDEGQYGMAALCFQRLESRGGGLAALPPTVLFKAALAFERGGDAAARDRALALLDARLDQPGAPPLPAGLAKLSRAELRASLEYKGERELAARSENWPMFLGGPERTAQGLGSVPYLEARLGYPLDATRSLADKGGTPETARSWLDQAVRKQTAMNYPVISGNHPIAVGNLLVFRGAWGVHAVNVKTGQLEWESKSEAGLAAQTSARSGPETNSQVFNSLPLYREQFPWLFFDNSMVGTLSTDGALVYAVEDLALPPTTDPYGRGFPNVQGMRGGQWSRWNNHNRLVAYDLAGAGVVWEIGASDGDSPFADTFFLGCPLPLGGKLYCLAETNGEIRLLCLACQRGWNTEANRFKYQVELVWSQPLGQPNRRLTEEPLRRTQAIQLAYADGILVCPTHAGVVIGVDLLTRSLVWAHAYQVQDGAALNEMDGLMVPPGGGRRMPVFAGGSNLIRPTWGVSAPMIAGGIVVFTAPDGKFVHALALKDGVELWRMPLENKPRASDLYLGGIVDGKALIIGQAGIRALDLKTGKLAWNLATGTPSGRGVASAGVYYLPVRAADGKAMEAGEVWAINVAKGAVVSKSASKQDAPGNLIFHDGELISQNSHKVVVYPQLSAKEAEITARLKENPEDPSGLAQRGELRYYRGDLAGARTDLRAALALEGLAAPERRRAREKLFEALYGLLDADFNRHEGDLPELTSLVAIAEPPGESEDARRKREEEQLDRKARVLRLAAAGRQRQGKMREALAAYLEFAGLEGRLLTSPEDSTVLLRPLVFAQGRVETLLRTATPAQKEELEAEFEREWQNVRQAADLAPLQRFAEFYAPICGQGREARLLLAERLLADKQFAEACAWLNQAILDSDPSRAARAYDALGRLYIAVGELDNAAYYYRLLAQRFPKVQVRDGKTGEQIYLDLSTDKRFLPYLSNLDGARRGLMGQVYQRIVMAEPKQTGNREVFRMLAALEPAGPSTPFFEKHRVAIDLQRRQVRIADRATDEERRIFTLQQNLLIPTVTQLRQGAVYHTLGTLLIFAYANGVYAYDTLAGKVLWSQDLLGGYDLPANSYGGSVQLHVAQEAGGRLRLISPQGTQEWVGTLGVVAPTGVCYTMKDRGLVMVDPLSGKERWVKTDVPTSMDVFGDDELILLVPQKRDRNHRAAVVVRALDGATLTSADFAPAWDRRFRVIGRRILLRDTNEDDELTLRLYDPVAGRDDWTLPLGKDGLVLNSLERRVVGGVNAAGKLTVVDVQTGAPVLRASLDNAPFANLASDTAAKEPNQLHLLGDCDHWYVFYNEVAQRPRDQNEPQIKRVQGQFGNQELRTVDVNGPVYAFDRRTGALRWQARLPLQSLMVEQFDALPIILCTGMFQKRPSAERIRGNYFLYSSALALDKRDGKQIDKAFERDNNQYLDLRLDPASSTIELVGANAKVVFQLLTDTAANLPPGEPAVMNRRSP
jgi:outer membrane protein assembly factor BamB